VKTGKPVNAVNAKKLRLKRRGKKGEGIGEGRGYEGRAAACLHSRLRKKDELIMIRQKMYQPQRGSTVLTMGKAHGSSP
jgi:hypothetical protein